MTTGMNTSMKVEFTILSLILMTVINLGWQYLAFSGPAWIMWHDPTTLQLTLSPLIWIEFVLADCALFIAAIVVWMP